MAIFTFSDFPEDVQLRILSFLSPYDLSTFACTSKRFVSLCHGESGVWYAMCDRRWGLETHIRKWGDGKVDFKTLFKTLSEFENLIGFWRRSGFGLGSWSGSSKPGIIGDAPLMVFEWGVSCLIGSKLLPSKDGTYNVTKSPFIWMSLSKNGEWVNYLKPSESAGSNQNDLVRVSLSHVEEGHVLVEESKGNNNGYKTNDIFGNVSHVQVDGSNSNINDDEGVAEIGSPRDWVTSEMYQYFANRTSPRAGAGERAWRRQRRREKERQGRRRWEPEHLVKVVDCSPTLSKPLQGLWKAICNDMTLDFYLVEYNEHGGISCRRIGESSNPCSCYEPVFWTSKATFIDSPLSKEEDYLYKTRYHVRPSSESEDIHKPIPSQIMHINSSYDMLFPDVEGISLYPGDEGRIWKYVDGSFGFGFLSYNYIVDMKHMVKHGCFRNIDQHYNG